MLFINEKISIPRSEFQFSFARSPGPGGQNVNKVNSKAVLRWTIDECRSIPTLMKRRFEKKFANRISSEGILVLSSHRYRDQPKNIQDCLDKLKAMLLSVAEAPKPRKKKKVSAAAKRRRLEAKRRRSAIKQMRGKPPSE
ncbi:alternative ribosome rescue aminoacyl-tRNA hydrolase ArfB [Mariniblastus sp.]|nr:alternative ribosome rescue aminoacyl-tRNA hydrolase ArfB [Mariniblastus sp.]